MYARKKKPQSGFSLVELLITIATVSTLSGIGLAVYAQYQERAYNSMALQQGMHLRTAFEAGISSSGSLGSSVFADNPALEFSIDGTLTCVSSCGGIDVNTLFPGYPSPGTPGIKIAMNLFENTQSYQIQTGHCKALIADNSSYDGWLISDEQASSRVSIPTDSGEVSQCATVLSGATLTPEPSTTPSATPSATPTIFVDPSETPTPSTTPEPPVCGDSICDQSELGGGEYECSDDCAVREEVDCGNFTYTQLHWQGQSEEDWNASQAVTCETECNNTGANEELGETGSGTVYMCPDEVTACPRSWNGSSCDINCGAC